MNFNVVPESSCCINARRKYPSTNFDPRLWSILVYYILERLTYGDKGQRGITAPPFGHAPMVPSAPPGPPGGGGRPLFPPDETTPDDHGMDQLTTPNAPMYDDPDKPLKMESMEEP